VITYFPKKPSEACKRANLVNIPAFCLLSRPRIVFQLPLQVPQAAHSYPPRWCDRMEVSEGFTQPAPYFQWLSLARTGLDRVSPVRT
jgi:hypothetical protein